MLETNFELIELTGHVPKRYKFLARFSPFAFVDIVMFAVHIKG
jgi:hypothetical protein